MHVILHYRSESYRLRRGAWRGRDGHQVHFLTWVTDDLLRREGAFPSDVELAARVAEVLGADASLEVDENATG